MKNRNEDAAKCSTGGCVATSLHDVSALATGWYVVEGQLYCALHGPYVALRSAREAGIGRKRAFRNTEVAKKWLSPAELRAWDQFQSDLADYHKKHGKLAHKELRTMTPRVFAWEFSQKGRINVELSTESLESQERQARDTLRGLGGL